MQSSIHPNYQAITVKCSCGFVCETRSTLARDLSVEICANCHPFYTGKEKQAADQGRVHAFNLRYGNTGSKK